MAFQNAVNMLCFEIVEVESRLREEFWREFEILWLEFKSEIELLWIEFKKDIMKLWQEYDDGMNSLRKEIWDNSKFCSNLYEMVNEIYNHLQIKSSFVEEAKFEVEEKLSIYRIGIHCSIKLFIEFLEFLRLKFWIEGDIS